ncbi:methyltransferase domain-containing protein [Henriciella sp. AS95]|uniref:SAM-dependent methyltransferase n=1 Tax=Henriciella sp. AS95 TaxID=3135782 RepID=UPI00316D64C7
MPGPVSDHYNSIDLLSRIERALGTIDRTPDTVTIEEIAPLEEFHIGARAATAALIPKLELKSSHRALDVGCATGGVSRYAANRYGCAVDGVDLTATFIEAGKTISSWLNLTSKVRLHHRNAAETDFEDDTFDCAWMFHVGMNIEHKGELFSEVKRVVKPGGRFLIYDIMRGRDASTPLRFPMPWASEGSISFVEPVETYEDGLEAAGFAIHSSVPQSDIAGAFFERLAEQTGKKPSAISTATLMGDGAGEKSANLLAAWQAEQIMPTAILAKVPG